MVRTRYRHATWLRASCREVLKNTVPASATATNASPALPAAVSSIREDRPVSLAPGSAAEPVHEAADPPGRRTGPPGVVARPASDSPIVELLGAAAAATTTRGGNFADSWLRYPG